ncbi:myosin-8-like [Mytilus californianus]|uniref:myosin-8-like n=1 Tax=Mytilus californianus TaxID=6549 RepID=UPI0022452DAD|nr:myosin-8-like [Mytilus californianus]
MEEQEKAAIDRNHDLLINNIILTEEFYNQLRWNQVLPESMITDVQACKTKEEKIKHLLYTLKLRGSDAFRKLRHVLHITGHNFLADQLYEEDNDVSIIKANDLFNKFPSIFNQVCDDLKSKFIKYLETKVKEKALAKFWNRLSLERLEGLENKKTCFLQERDMRVKLENKRKQVSCLKEELSDMDEKLRKRELEIQVFEKERDETRKRFKTELAVQARFNAANNSSIIRLREKFVSFNEKVKILNRQIAEFLSVNENLNDNQDNEKLSRLEQNVKTILHIVKQQQDTVESKTTERESVLALLKKSTNKSEPLSDIVKRYLEREEKAKSIVNREIEKLIEILRKSNKPQYKNKSNAGTDMKHLRNMVATVRVEVEHLKKKLEWKDDQITDLIKETMMLRQYQKTKDDNTVSETLKGAIVTSPVSSPDSTYEMQLAYKKFDNYLASNPALPNRNRRRGSLADVDLEPDPDETDISFVDKKDYQGPETPRVKFPELELTKSENTPRSKTFYRRYSEMSEQDLATILETDDNVEFEKLMTLIAKKTQPAKLPLICKDAMSVDFSRESLGTDNI